MVLKSRTAETRMMPLRNMPCLFCRSDDSPAARVVPYDSPAMNFGDCQRLFLVVYRRMKFATEVRSSSTPWKVDGFVLFSACEKPVETGSMKTRSVRSKIDWLFWMSS